MSDQSNLSEKSDLARVVDDLTNGYIVLMTCTNGTNTHLQGCWSTHDVAAITDTTIQVLVIDITDWPKLCEPDEWGCYLEAVNGCTRQKISQERMEFLDKLPRKFLKL